MTIDKERIDRYLLIHRYWVISDSKLLSMVRENNSDFNAFIDGIHVYVSARAI